MLEKANIPFVAVDQDIGVVRKGRQLGKQVYFGDMKDTTAEEAARLGRTAAVYITSWDVNRAKALAVALHHFYPQLDVYVRARTLRDQDELAATGIKYAGTGYIESTLVRGAMLLRELGVPRPMSMNSSKNCIQTTSR